METENSYYLVTEMCGGGDLMSRICSRKRLDELETRRYIRQIVSAVDYLHKAGIIHRYSTYFLSPCVSAWLSLSLSSFLSFLLLYLVIVSIHWHMSTFTTFLTVIMTL